MTSQLYTNIKMENSVFYIDSRRPTRFYLKRLKNNVIKNTSNIVESKPESTSNFKERDLHPLLVRFLNDNPQFNLYSKTIYHEKSKKNKQGVDIWNYPDIVGVHFPFIDEYQEQTLNFVKMMQLSKPKIYSFELKVSLHWSNLKECYFQAVSNSSWANEGYLVVFKMISSGDDNKMINELRRLNASFGIGVIQLEPSLEESKILLSSQVRELDITTLDMLIEKNENFAKFIKSVTADMKVGEKERIVTNNYDVIYDDEKLDKHKKDKNIAKENLE